MKYDKLVRDNIPAIIKKSGGECTFKRINNDEVIPYLFKKVREEIDELEADKSPEEMADVLEVIDSLITLLNFDMDDINEIKNRKASINGKFQKNTILIESKKSDGFDLFKDFLLKNEKNEDEPALVCSSFNNFRSKNIRKNNPKFEELHRPLADNSNLATLGDAIIRFCYTEILFKEGGKISERRKEIESDEFWLEK